MLLKWFWEQKFYPQLTTFATYSTIHMTPTLHNSWNTLYEKIVDELIFIQQTANTRTFTAQHGQIFAYRVHWKYQFPNSLLHLGNPTLVVDNISIRCLQKITLNDKDGMHLLISTQASYSANIHHRTVILTVLCVTWYHILTLNTRGRTKNENNQMISQSFTSQWMNVVYGMRGSLVEKLIIFHYDCLICRVSLVMYS